MKAVAMASAAAVNMRHIVTLKPGAMVGEIALFSANAKRMATVRTKDHCEVLIPRRISTD